MLKADPSPSRFLFVGGNRVFKRLRPVTAVVPLALLLAGCGSDTSAISYTSGGTGGAGAGGVVAGAGGAVAFSVYDWVTDKPVQTCLDEIAEFQITITGEAPLTVVANFAPGLAPGSVVFTYDGIDQPIQDIFPYALAPDDNGDFSGPKPPLAPGKHTLSVAAYQQAGAIGSLLGKASVALTVINGGA